MTGAHVAAYYPSWSTYDRAYPPNEIPVEKLTHLYYAFANIVNGVLAPGDQWADMDKPYELNGATFRGAFEVFNRRDSPLRQRNPHLKTILSIGGWTFSKEFSLVARTPQSRQTFTQSVCEWMTKYNFDGIDLDWEFPGSGGLPTNARDPADPQNFTLLLEALRQGLDQLAQQQGRDKYLLTVATAYAESLHRFLDMPGLARTCDFVNIMTYECVGSWSTATGHAAPMSCILNAVRAYTMRGVPRHKIIPGIPMSGRAFAGVGSPNVGAPVGAGMADGSWAKGIVDWNDLCAKYTQAQGYQRIMDPAAGTPILYNPQTQIWISYEDQESVTLKCQAIKELGLGGVFGWDISQDRRGDLLDPARRVLL
ncbi:hypothetical protein AMAG_15291 [Allomyces macrogynus ATCC 38327]|uniref:GH18 domain-containing protein n=1 Tax=Allomyces macrogynus (strain ATCC 38327) TaxID=578462 RepID=A0A0L0T8L5_ALLM3|nr:hypothetical protein GGF31_006206 [Allomyces arbusculus]KNE71036.1 hypothetical protein AMAG_15291 [Allomyces macrogynus ATCC 38327]|eukprot:KNE71036.1 hypothetical protein AMAG_15291 [Allomyces macrogynus ATCC 38327]